MFHFTCMQCDFALDIDYIPRDYILPNGSVLAMPQRHVWCVTCGTIRPAESLCQNEAPTRDPSIFYARRAIRTGPPACLKCRATDFVLPDSDWADLIHVPCGGILKAAATLFGGSSMPIRPHRYSPEGELIARGFRTLQQMASFVKRNSSFGSTN